FYKQFAITIAASTAISCFVSLTLSPALAALLLKPHGHGSEKRGIGWYLSAPLRYFFKGFNAAFDGMSHGYAWLTGRIIRLPVILLVIYGGLLFMTYERLAATPTGLIPQLDRTYFIAVFQLPPGSTLDRTDKVVRAASDIMIKRPGVLHAVAFAGFDGATFTNAPNTAVIFVRLKDFEDRIKEGITKDQILTDLRQQMFALREAFAFVIEPPSVPGIGTGGGLKGYVQDRSGRGAPALEGAAWGVAGAAGQVP